MNSIFTREESNRKRQVELDVAKAIAIIFMVWVHANEYYQGESYVGGVYNRVVEFLGSPPAAPVFMILLGVGIVFSRKKNPKKLAERGVKLLAGGYLLSFTRDLIPYYFMYKEQGDPELITDAISLLWGADILQFSGLAFLFFALVVKYDWSNKILFVLWCGFTSLHLIIRGITFDSHFANAFFGLFWGTDSYSWFPFLNWITYPMVGYVFGKYLIRCTDKQTFYKNIFIYSASVSVPAWIYSTINNIQFGAFGELWQDAYYHHDLIGNLVLVSFALFWISLVYFLVPYIPENIKHLCARWSKNTTSIYCISYIILGFSLIWVPSESFTPILVCISGIIIFVASDIVCLIIGYLKNYLAVSKAYTKVIE